MTNDNYTNVLQNHLNSDIKIHHLIDSCNGVIDGSSFDRNKTVIGFGRKNTMEEKKLRNIY